MARGGSRAFLSPSFLRSAVFIHCARQMTHEHSIHHHHPPSPSSSSLKPEAGFKRSSFASVGNADRFLSTILGAGSKFLDRFFVLLIHLFLNFPRESKFASFFLNVCPRLFGRERRKFGRSEYISATILIYCYNNLHLIIYKKKFLRKMKNPEQENLSLESRYLDIEVITTIHKKIIPRRKTCMKKKIARCFVLN